MTPTLNQSESLAAAAAAGDYNDETEDEEVKLTCIAGVRDTFHDSDLDTASSHDDLEDEEEEIK